MDRELLAISLKMGDDVFAQASLVFGHYLQPVQSLKGFLQFFEVVMEVHE